MRNVIVDLKNTVIIHAAILQHVNCFQMQLVQQAPAVISKHANLNYLVQFAALLVLSAFALLLTVFYRLESRESLLRGQPIGNPEVEGGS